MIDFIKKFFGFHVHTWDAWYPLYASDLTEVGRKRRCLTCPKVDQEFYPDGH